MAHKLIAPRMGEGIEELNIIRWLKAEGERVSEMEPVVEVETDKVVTEIPSPAAGVILKRMVAEGQPVGVGETLAWIGEPGEDISEEKLEFPQNHLIEPTEDIHTGEVSTAQNRDKFFSPLVRKIAQENQVDLNQVTGSGKDGRITKNDVLQFIASRDTQSEKLPDLGPETESIPSRPSSSSTIQPISHIRRTIAERMRVSLQTSPHVLTVMEAALQQVLMHRDANKELFAQDGIHLTLTAYFIGAIVTALKANPLVNASWSDEGIIIHPEINIGMAVSLGSDGLIVPVIKQADTLSLLGIARQVNDLAARARTGTLHPQEVKGGTFSLTNHGLGGSLFASPIINQPQVGILGTGRMQKRAIVLTDAQGHDSIAIRAMIYLSFVFDHRVLDGESADRFLGAVKNKLENWD